MNLVGNKAPDFKATAVMPDNSFKEISLKDYEGKYIVLFFYPLDFTFVCPTEIIAFDHRLEDFKKRNAEVIGVSIDSQFTHLAWKNTPVEKGGIGNIQYPLVADVSKQISRDYDVLFNDSVALRGLFIIGKDGIVKHATVNFLDFGRNIDEVLRTLDAIQFVDEHGEACPANWKPGKPGMKPTPEGVAEYLAEHAEEL